MPLLSFFLLSNRVFFFAYSRTESVKKSCPVLTHLRSENGVKFTLKPPYGRFRKTCRGSRVQTFAYFNYFIGSWQSGVNVNA